MSASFNAKSTPTNCSLSCIRAMIVCPCNGDFYESSIFVLPKQTSSCCPKLQKITTPHRISSTKQKVNGDWVARVASFSYTNPYKFRRSLPPLLLRHIYEWTFSGYLILIGSFSSCLHYFSKANRFHVSRKAYIWIFHWLPGWTVLNWLLRGESSKVLTHYVTKNNGNLIQTSEPIVITGF